MSFRCDLCEKTFSRPSAKKRHERTAHGNQKFRCTYCHADFNRMDSYRRHSKHCKNMTRDPFDDIDLYDAEERVIESEMAKLESPAEIKRWSVTKGLTNHPTVESRLKGKVHKCRHCFQTFHRYAAKSNHERGCRSRGPTPDREGGSRSHHPPPSRSSGDSGTQPDDAISTTPFTSTDQTGSRDQPSTSGSGHVHPSSTYRCSVCGVRFHTRRELYLHAGTSHPQTGRGVRLQSPPWRKGHEPFENDENLKRVYDANVSLILENDRQDPVQSVYNVPIDNSFSVEQLVAAAENIYDRQDRAFRLNLEFGLILVNTETGDYRYFKPFSNEELFQRPIYVSKRSDLKKLKLRLQEFEVTDFMLRQRPDTKWKPRLVTNVRFVLSHLTYPLGKGSTLLPDHVMKSASIVALDKSWHGQPYKDQLCFFRCLAVHRGHGTRGLERETLHLYSRWLDYARPHYPDVPDDPSRFPGMPLDRLPHAETCFEININAYHLDENGVATPVYKSRCRHEDTLFLNVYRHHLSYISNFRAYAKKYQCGTCSRHFPNSRNMLRHQRTCSGKTRYQFPGGFYTTPDSVFDKLEECGVKVPVEQRLFKHFVTFDFEAYLERLPGEGSEKLTFTHRHVPISVSICSNVPGYTEPHCIVDPDMDSLIKRMIEYMSYIRETCQILYQDKFCETFDYIDKEIRTMETGEMIVHLSDGDFVVMDDAETKEECEEMVKKLNEARDKLLGYCSQIVCLGFNSARYDCNLVKKVLAKHLRMHESEETFTVKRNNQYACLSNEHFKFLDITNYLAPGLSYAKFLKAFGVKENKGFFPYEWFDSADKLECTELPPLGPAWYSTLKEKSVLEDGNRPPEENYAEALRAWKDHGMTTFRDYLVYYNNADVGPFVEAVVNLQSYYFERNIDIFKTSISLPGLARRMLFDNGHESGASFALIDEKNSDLYRTIKNNIVGGPSVIFHRHHEVGRTFIRNNPDKPCRNISGFDANALYLYCIGKDMPTGPFVRRKLENDFKPEKRDKYMSAYHWMDYLNSTRGLHIQHKFNRGREKRVGRYPVDGYDPETNTVYQFHGCYFHHHTCWMTRNVKNERWLKEHPQKYEETLRISNYIRAAGYELVEMWECEFREQTKRDERLDKFVKGRKSEVPHRSLREAEILSKVRSGSLFGMVECDIRVPDRWPSHFRHPTLTPSEYFAEMCPLFCTAEIPFDVIGPHMQEHVRSFGLSQKSRRLLVGGMRARQMLIATPLLKWYLEHGLEVTRIYQVVEYTPNACFRKFVRDVSDARREGDLDPDKAIIADTKKLIGNSAFGSTIMDQEKFNTVKYVQGDDEVAMAFNEPQFKRLEVLSEEDEYYEVTKAKDSICLDLPVQIGYFILQYAKLHMLQFYYDFVDKYVDRADFQYCEMDTDSAYMALSGADLESVIRPELLDDYKHSLQGFCRDYPEVSADAEFHWFPRTCCDRHAKYDRRTPGLFKLEYRGDHIIGLSSKTYIVSRVKSVPVSDTVIKARNLLRNALNRKPKRLRRNPRTVREVKFSSKGVSKRLVRAPVSIFRDVLKTKRSRIGLNRGFRARGCGVETYEQYRNGFTYFYCKRKVLDDGVTTVPLDLELCPAPKKRDDEAREREESLTDAVESPMEVDPFQSPERVDIGGSPMEVDPFQSP